MKIISYTFALLGIIWTIISISLTLLLSIIIFPSLYFVDKRFCLYIIVLVFAKLLCFILLPLGFIYKIISIIIKSKTKIEDTSTYLKFIIISENQRGNAILSGLFNDIFITSKGYKYGNSDETISSVTGKNVRRKTLTKIGKWFNTILNFFEENHSTKNIEDDEYEPN